MFISSSHSAKAAPQKLKTYTYSSAVVTSPLDYNTVNEWLDGLKMGRYKSNFKERGITTINEVLTLDKQQLRKMDITLPGHISKITRSIALGKKPKSYTYSSSIITCPLDYKTVNEWLDGLRMGRYKSNFEERGITTAEVLALDEHQLRKMDITLPGHISKITRSIALGNQKLGREPSVSVNDDY